MLFLVLLCFFYLFFLFLLVCFVVIVVVVVSELAVGLVVSLVGSWYRWESEQAVREGGGGVGEVGSLTRGSEGDGLGLFNANS